MDCAYHPGKEAIAECSKCGRPLCEECSKSSSNLCLDCSILQTDVGQEETSGVQLMNWNAWIRSFIMPDKAFGASKELNLYTGTAMNLLVGLVNAGILAFLLVSMGKMPGGDNSVTGVFVYTTQFIIFLFIWLVTTLVAYSFAMLAGGMGSLKQHIYFFSLLIPFSPLVILILGALFSFMLSIHLAVLIMGSIVITIYIVNIVVVAIEKAHRLGFLQAAVSGVISVIITGGAVGLLIFAMRK